MTVSGKQVFCGEDIARGTYFQEKSYPIEPMHIIMNLAIQSGTDAPDANTIFPNYYEIDYIRVWRKPPHSCVINISSNNFAPLGDGSVGLYFMELTYTNEVIRVPNKIIAPLASNAGSVIVKSSANVLFQSGNKIELLPGFEVEAGANFEAFIEPCSATSGKNSSLIENDPSNNNDISQKPQILLLINQIIPHKHLIKSFSFLQILTVFKLILNIPSQPNPPSLSPSKTS